jgi:hypothetical protein
MTIPTERTVSIWTRVGSRRGQPISSLGGTSAYPSILRSQHNRSPFARAREGELVEVGCIGGSGRTGTVLACMAVLAGIPPTEAVAWVRATYRADAVETSEQEEWVRWFAQWAESHPGDPSAYALG